jgi:type VI protein secretion system component VasK
VLRSVVTRSVCVLCCSWPLTPHYVWCIACSAKHASQSAAAEEEEEQEQQEEEQQEEQQEEEEEEEQQEEEEAAGKKRKRPKSSDAPRQRSEHKARANVLRCASDPASLAACLSVCTWAVPNAANANRSDMSPRTGVPQTRQ